MILEAAIIGTTTYGMYRVAREEHFTKKKVKKDISKKWNILMDSIGNQSENKINQSFEMLNLFPKYYGFDAIISIPYGKKYTDIVQMIPAIESCYKADVATNIAEDSRNCAYMRVHFLNKDINSKDKLKFDWFRTFYNIEGCITKSGETLSVESIKDITSPNNEVVGYSIKSKIPLGLSYDKIKGSYSTITKTLGKCYFNFDYKTMKLETSIINKPIEDDTKFKIIKVKPWELYFAMGYDWKSIILDYSMNANCLIGGNQGTGKTNAMICAFINLCNQCAGNDYDDSFDLLICNIGEKEDLRVFRDVKQCKYYANKMSELKSILLFLMKEMKRRNQIFAQCKKFVFNIHQYNKLVEGSENKKLKVIHFLADEIADLAENDEIQKILWDLIRKSRSSGIYITVGTQRGSVKNLDSEIKGQLANQISFSQPNTASALTIMSGEDVAKKVVELEKKRECLVSYMEGLKIAKTLYLDSDMMEEYLKDVILDAEESKNNKFKLDLKGNILTEEISKIKNIKKLTNIKSDENNDNVIEIKSKKKSTRYINLKEMQTQEEA